MAGALKGITVEIGGDTTKLGKALQDVNGKTRSLQNELRGINSLLKFNPGNVTLLKQKQDLLNKSIQETKEKLKTLKDAEQQVNEQFAKGEITEEQFRDFQREIVATEQKLASLEKELEQFGSVGAQRVAAVGEKMQAVGQSIESAGRAFAPFSAAAAAVLGGSVMVASNFTDAMAKVNTIADTSTVSLDTLRGQILDLSNQTGISANEIAEATYNAISAGQDTADAVAFVANATALAKAGFTDTGAAIDVLTTIMNAYGLEAQEVGNVSDMLIQIQNKGKTTVAELASTMGKVIPTANAMGVGLDQLGAGYAIMTANGIATAETTTYLNSMLNELGKTGTKASEALKSQTGQSFQELMASGASLGDVLNILQGAADESGVSLMDLFGSAEAGKAALTLLSGGVEEFNSMVGEMDGSVGATSAAMDKLKTPSAQAKIALNQIKNSGIELGSSLLNALAPVISAVASAIQTMTEKFNNLPSGVQTAIGVVLGLVAAIAPVLIAVGKVVSAIGTLMTYAPMIVNAFGMVKTALLAVGTAFKAVGAAMLANPIGIVIAIIVALGAALVVAYQKSETFRNIVNTAFAQVKEVVGNVVSALVTFFTQTLPQGIENMLMFFLTLPLRIQAAIVSAIGIVANWVANIKNTAVNGIKTMVTNVISSASTIPSRIKSAIQAAISAVISWGASMRSAAVSAMQTMISGAISACANIGSKFLSVGKSIIDGVKSGIKNAIGGLYNEIYDSMSGLVGKAKNALGINSPSKVFASVVGAAIPEGIAKGISDNTRIAANAVGTLSDALVTPDINGGTFNRKVAETFAPANNTDTGTGSVVAVLNDIYDRLDRMQVVLDSGQLVGGITDKVDRALGIRSAKAARGW